MRHRALSAPLGDEYRDDVGNARLAKDPRVDALLEHGQRIPDDEPIGGERAVGFTFVSIGHELNGQRRADERIERYARSRRDTCDLSIMQIGLCPIFPAIGVLAWIFR